MTQPCVHLQIAPDSVPTLPCWFGEVTIIAHVLAHDGILQTIEAEVRLVRPRFGTYEVLDFVVVLIGYIVSGEATLQAFYDRLTPFASAFMALFGRHRLPHRSTLSRFLASVNQESMEALRTLFHQDLIVRSAQSFPPGGLWDRRQTHWIVVDIDATKQAARQRALPQGSSLPTPHRRFDQVCAPGYLGRKRGEVARSRTTVLQAHSHQWLGTFGGPGNGNYRGELARALEATISYAGWLCLPLSQILLRLDGLYGNAAPLRDLLTLGVGVIVRGKDYALLNLPAVAARLGGIADAHTIHPESGTARALFDCPQTPLTPTGPWVRMIVAAHPTSLTPAAIGVLRQGVVYELFFTTMPQEAFTPTDVLDLYLHRGSFETVLADEDQEQDPDRWCSHTTNGQEWCQILHQGIWNLRQALGQQAFPTTMRLTEFAPAQVNEPVQRDEPVQKDKPVQRIPSVSYGPPQWARRSWTAGFAGSDFALQPDGTLRCPAGSPLYPQERRPEAKGSLRVLYAARLCYCRPCPLRSQCQEAATTIKPRRVSAVFWPIPASDVAPLPTATFSGAGEPVLPPPPPKLAVFPVLWGDWQRCQIRRRWIRVLRHQTVDLTFGSVAPEEPKEPSHPPAVQTRAQRAHWRMTWKQRMARNAATTPLEVTIHGLPATFAQCIGVEVVTAA